MANEPIVEPEDITPVEDVVQDPEPTDPDIELDPVALKAERDAAKAERDLQHKRATKAEAELKKFKTLETNPNPDERFERLELKTEGYNSDEVDFLMQNGGREALKNKIVTTAIESMRAKIKSEQATPSGTGKSTVYQTFTEKDLKRMTQEQLEKIIPQE